MTNEKIIDELLSKANICYKRQLRKRCPSLARELDMKKPVKLIDDQVFNCWMELIVYTCGNIINDFCPDAEVEIELDGNNSNLKVTLSEADEKILQTKIKDMVV